jgi:hypothetical protein
MQSSGNEQCLCFQHTGAANRAYVCLNSISHPELERHVTLCELVHVDGLEHTLQNTMAIAGVSDPHFNKPAGHLTSTIACWGVTIL